MDFSKYGVKHAPSCESCEYYEYDEYTDTYGCSLSLDEDEMSDFLGFNTKGCTTINSTMSIKACIGRYSFPTLLFSNFNKNSTLWHTDVSYSVHFFSSYISFCT